MEDPEQSDRIGVVSVVTYAAGQDGANKVHNFEGPAMQTEKRKEYYINGIQYTKDQWSELKEVGKLEGYLDKSLY